VVGLALFLSPSPSRHTPRCRCRFRFFPRHASREARPGQACRRTCLSGPENLESGKTATGLFFLSASTRSSLSFFASLCFRFRSPFCFVSVVELALFSEPFYISPHLSRCRCRFRFYPRHA
jgi:hypothetical protein